jgi:pimeloyl-ACP methyl ester carboxylesterase
MSVVNHRTGTVSRRGAPGIGLLPSLVAFSIAPLNVAVSSAPLLAGDGGTPAFYAWSGELDGQPGKILRQEPGSADLANAGRSVRILYISTDGLDGMRKVPVSGVLYVPKGEAPKDGWPLIAWAHGTVGVADVCAPSFGGRSERDVTYLNFWLQQGYAIVATDYQGLGVPGAHPYLATRPEAYSVLDSIRAVQRASFGLSKKVVVVGQSQGGAAAFATAAYAPSYAPELDIRGAVATGTPYFSPETQAARRAKRSPDAVDGKLAYTFLLLSTVEQIDSSFSMTDFVTDAAQPVVIGVSKTCLRQIARQIIDAKLTYTLSFKKDPAPMLSKVVELMGYPTLSIKPPVFLGTGGRDADVPPEVQLHLGADACANGTRIEQHVYPELDHSGAVNASTVDSVVFARKAFAGEAIAGNCASRPRL